jgi:hypothetical protein
MPAGAGPSSTPLQDVVREPEADGAQRVVSERPYASVRRLELDSAPHEVTANATATATRRDGTYDE